MKATVIEFGWSGSYAAPRDFDLNALKNLVRVERKAKNYIPKADESEITIKIGADFTDEKEEIEKLELKEITEDRDNYKKWYHDGKAEFEKVKNELACLKKTIEVIKKEEE
jgi:hypothetical protein